MLCCVLVLGTVTATDVAADEAHAEVHPGVTDLDAFFADGDIFRMDVTDLVFMGANLIGHTSIITYSVQRILKVMTKATYARLAQATVVVHVLWTILLFVGTFVGFFYPPYAWWQIDLLSFTILSWFPFGLKCALTVWMRWFQKKAGIYDGDTRTFMVIALHNIFKKEFTRKKTALVSACFFVASYLISIGVLAHWF